MQPDQPAVPAVGRPVDLHFGLRPTAGSGSSRRAQEAEVIRAAIAWRDGPDLAQVGTDEIGMALVAAVDALPPPSAGLSVGTLTVDLVPADQVPSYGVRAELVHDTLTAAQPGDMFSFEQAPGQRVTVVVARSYAVEQPKTATPPARAFLGERPCSDPGCACHGPDPLAGPPLGNLRKPPRPAGPKPVA